MDPKFQPEWSQTGKETGTEVCTYFPDQKGARSQAGQRVIGTTDEGVEVSVPHTPYRNMMDPAGNVVPFPISTNRDLKNLDANYEKVRLAQARQKGWVLWDYNPNIEPRHFVAGSAAAWEAEREVERAKRLAAAAKASARYNAMSKDKVTQLVEAVAGSQRLSEQLLNALADGNLAKAEKIAARAGKAKGDAGAE